MGACVVRAAMAAVTAAVAVSVVPEAVAYPRPVSTVVLRAARGDGGSATFEEDTRVVSADGRFVAYSTDGALVPEDKDSHQDVYVYDRRARRAQLVSRPPLVQHGETRGDLPVELFSYFRPYMTPSGSHIAYVRQNQLELLPAVFLWSRATGTSTLVSVNDAGAPIDGSFASVSDDGRLVAFLTDDPDSPGMSAAVVRDMVRKRIVYRTRRADGSPTKTHVGAPQLSGNGRFLAFVTDAGNMDPKAPPLPPESALCGALRVGCPPPQLYVADVRSGRAEIASVGSDGTPTRSAIDTVNISRDGRIVLFQVASAVGVIPTTAGVATLVRDRKLRTLENVQVTSAGETISSGLMNGALSADGRHVAFFRAVIENGFLRGYEVLVHDRAIGVTEATGIVGPAPAVSMTASGDALVVARTQTIPGGANSRADLVFQARGPARGVQSVAVRRSGSRVVVSGRATFGGTTLRAIPDGKSDSEQPAAEMGQELTRFDVVQRVEDESLLLRWTVDRLPSTLGPKPVEDLVNRIGQVLPTYPPSFGGDARVSYRARFTVDGTPYEVRARRLSNDPPDATTTIDDLREFASFGLYKCGEAVCEKIATLRGGLGTAGHEVRVRLPFSALKAKPGAVIANLTAAVTLNGSDTSNPPVLDTTSPPVTVRTLRASVTVRAGSSRGKPTKAVPALRANGKYDATVPRMTYILSRVCLGTGCTETKTAAPD